MTKAITLAEEAIISKIYLIRGKKVMLDRDLAELYGVETRVLNQAVRRNEKRFPDDFMFQLTEGEIKNLISQNVTSSWGGVRKPPLAFTEQGVAMLSSVLNSETAIEVNIQIIRIFTRMRQLLLTHKDILIKLEKLEKKMLKQNTRIKQSEEDIQVIFAALKELLNPSEPRPRVGFRRSDEKD
jgi:ORF6N domain